MTFVVVVVVVFCVRSQRSGEQLLKKGKSAGVDNIPAELVQAGGEDVITALTTICNKIWQTGQAEEAVEGQH